jgi:hypothetical protein
MSRVVEERKVIGQVLQFRKLPQFLGVGEVIQRNLKLFRTACSSVVHTRNEGTQDVRPLLKINIGGKPRCYIAWEGRSNVRIR